MPKLPTLEQFVNEAKKTPDQKIAELNARKTLIQGKKDDANSKNKTDLVKRYEADIEIIDAKIDKLRLPIK